jgi:DNA-directed RNA polymerase specialized sigma24 family protein
VESNLAVPSGRPHVHLDAALETLPHLQRQTIALLYTHDLPATDAAVILGRTPSAIRQLHRRALTSLAAAVGT